MTRHLAALLLLFPACSRPEPTPVERAIGWLAGQQREGVWRSETYTLLGSGQALTPFVLYALSHARPEERAPHRTAIDRALDRLPLRGNEYPTYSLSLSLLALRRLRPGADTSALERELRSKQLTEALGWTEADPEYGGWDQGAAPARKPECQRPDLSVTAFACEALGADPKAQAFARKCAAAGGGFFFTPSRAWEAQNKAGPGKGYATATYDAHRILGTKPEAPPTLDALPPDWREGLFFYHAFARAKVSPSPAHAAEIAARQRPDGSFRNFQGLMKEDDPLVATGLALVALCLSR